MATTGKIGKITSDPKGFNVSNPPAPDVSFTPVTDDQWKLALAAKEHGWDVSVEGTPPNCTSVSAL